MTSAGSRILQETRGEPSLLLDRCVLLAERVSTLEAQLTGAREALERIAEDSPYSQRPAAERDSDAVKWRRGIARDWLAGLGADPATQETAS